MTVRRRRWLRCLLAGIEKDVTGSGSCAYLRGPALCSTRMFGVAGRAEGLGTTLAKLRMMPTDFAVAVDALRQMRTHTSSDRALLRRVGCAVLAWGRHTSLP